MAYEEGAMIRGYSRKVCNGRVFKRFSPYHIGESPTQPGCTIETTLSVVRPSEFVPFVAKVFEAGHQKHGIKICHIC